MADSGPYRLRFGENRPCTRSSTAMKKAPNIAEANNTSAKSGFGTSSPGTTSDLTE